MTETTQQAGAGESFAELFGSSARSFKEGEIARGTVLSIGDDFGVSAPEFALFYLGLGFRAD